MIEEGEKGLEDLEGRKGQSGRRGSVLPAFYPFSFNPSKSQVLFLFPLP
jgi:hypothetical protein